MLVSKTCYFFRVSRKGLLNLVFYGNHSVDSYTYTCQLMGMEEKGRVRGGGGGGGGEGGRGRGSDLSIVWMVISL